MVTREERSVYIVSLVRWFAAERHGMESVVKKEK